MPPLPYDIKLMTLRQGVPDTGVPSGTVGVSAGGDSMIASTPSDDARR